MTTWFERLTGFAEADYESTRSRLSMSGDRLHSRVNGRSFGAGTLEVPSLEELRERAARERSGLRGRLRVVPLRGDVRRLHAEPAFRHALFQVASQFNLLEMVSPSATPEHGVAGYERDPTQGPACAIAAGAATIYRNYFVPVLGGIGQTATRQIDALADLGAALGNRDESLWRMRNGYVQPRSEGLPAVRRRLASLGESGLDALRGLLRIGVHAGVEVTDGPAAEGAQQVSQAFCSALPVSYNPFPAADWEPFARLVLEAAYEATACAAIVNAATRGSNVVLLTRLGGGAFGNDDRWIDDAIIRALDSVRDVDLDLRLVSYGSPGAALAALAGRYA